MGGENVERFRLDIDDGKAREKTEGAAAGFDRLADSIDRSTDAGARATTAAGGQSVAMNGLVENMKKTHAAAKGSAGAHKEAAKSFTEAKHTGKELAQMAEHLTGTHIGLAGVIRGAMNPAFLAAAVASLAIGKALQEYKEHQAQLTKAIEDSVQWVISYSAALDENAGKLLTFNDFQKQITTAGRELASLKMDEKIKLNTEALVKANKEYEHANSLYKMELHTGGLISLSREQNNKQLSMAETAMRKAKGEIISLTLETEALTRANAKGFKTVDEYTNSMNYWQGIAHKADAVTRNMPPGVDALRISQEKLNAEWRVGAVDLAEYKRRMDQLFAINDAANKAPKKSGGASVLNAKKDFFEKIAAMEAKAEKDSVARQIATINLERNNMRADAERIIKDKTQLAAAIVRIEASAVNQKKVIWADERRKLAELDAAQFKGAQDRTLAFNKALKKDGDDRVKAAVLLQNRISLIGKKGYALQRQMLKNEANKEIAIAREKYDNMLVEWEEYQIEYQEIAARYSAGNVEIAVAEGEAKKASYIGAANAAMGAMSGIFGKNKKFAKVQAGMNLFQGITSVWAQWGAYPPVAAALTILVALAAKKQIDAIDNSPDPGAGQAHKGMRVPRSGSYLLERDEVVVPNTNDLMSISDSITKVAMDKDSSGGGTQINMNAPWYGGPQALRDVAREGNKVKRKVTPARRRE